MRTGFSVVCLLVVGTLVVSPARTKQDPFAKKLDQDREIQQALNRLTFGPQPGDVERVKRIGVKKWVEDQLHPEKIGDNPELDDKLGALPTLRLTNDQLLLEYPPPFLIRQYANGTLPMPREQEARQIAENLVANLRERREGKQDSDGAARPRLALLSPEDRRKFWQENNPQQAVTYDLWEAKIYRAALSDRQLLEVLDDFWFNHFNIFLDKGLDRYLIAQYERDAIRPNVFGKFGLLLEATAKSPAMLFYLDNWQSVGTFSRVAERQRLGGQKPRGLNENYARELLELHTLGVDGGYTQKDVIEVARCFTGWTIRAPRQGGGFYFNPNMHDTGKKVVLGHVIKEGGGIEDGEKVLRILAHHPATAHHICYELAQRFVADTPPPALVDRMARTFLDKDGDLREVMKTMLNSAEFWSEGAYLGKTKSPLEFAISAVRALDVDLDDAFVLSNQLAVLGEPLYRKREPTGYSNAGSDWLNSAALLARMNFAMALAANRIRGVTVAAQRFQEESDAGAIAASLLLRPPGEQTLQAISPAQAQHKTGPGYVMGLVIGSPDFQRH
jgi:uncharacterized protein (DUF1800 family)